MAQAALAVLDHPDWQDVFGPDSLAEVPLAAVVEGRVVTGTIDRLIVRPGLVRIVDFKTAPTARADRGDSGGLSAPDGGLCRGAEGDPSRPPRGSRCSIPTRRNCSPCRRRCWRRRSWTFPPRRILSA
jgi:hypothetical protein